MTLSTGQPLADRYLLLEPLGRGGMSVVWRGVDTVLDRPVAVKVLGARAAIDPALRALIQREARAAAQLTHPGITAVHDYGEAALPGGAVLPYVIMELLTGRTLRQRLTDGPLPWPEALRLAGAVAGALAAAHRRGIVHRDITPANIMLTSTGIKVLDFGIAALAGGPGDPDGSGLLGTPAYVAPERLAEAPAAPTVDVYALGAVLYEALTGAPPVPAASWAELSRAYRQPPRVPPPAVPGLPRAAAELCLRCLATDPAARPAAADLVDPLRQLLDRPGAAGHGYPADPAGTREPPGTRVPDPGAPAPAALPEPPATTGQLPGGVPDRRRSILVAVVIALVAVVIALVAAGVPAVFAHRHAAPALLTPPAATGPAAGTNPTSPASPASSADPTSPAGSAAPGSAAGTGPAAAVDHLLDLVRTGAGTGEIRADVATDLTNLLTDLRRQLASGTPPDLAERIAQLRAKVTDRRAEHAVSARYADLLEAQLRTLWPG